MDIDTLVAAYPSLYHMADVRNLRAIRTRGLLSTAALLDLYGYNGADRQRIERMHRPETVRIDHPSYGAAYVRDQKPMRYKDLVTSVLDATPEQFLEFINGRVFFWPTVKRLTTMNKARAYRSSDQVVLICDTASLVKAHTSGILLSPMNSGATRPVAHPRSIEMFKTIKNFDWSSSRPSSLKVAEITVSYAVPDILEHVAAIEIWRDGKCLRRF